MIARDEIVGLLDEELEVLGTEDESLNGLQVQGAADVGRVALATDAALSVYRRAAALGCEMLVVHHGILWSQPKPITGLLYEQVRTLVDEEMSLYAAHLPLDLHPRLGNNAELARMVGLVGPAPGGRRSEAGPRSCPSARSASARWASSRAEAARCFPRPSTAGSTASSRARPPTGPITWLSRPGST
jgi:putative NIF3 family GTP cyclohydrolase 1 type 2